MSVGSGYLPCGKSSNENKPCPRQPRARAWKRSGPQQAPRLRGLRQPFVSRVHGLTADPDGVRGLHAFFPSLLGGYVSLLLPWKALFKIVFPSSFTFFYIFLRAGLFWAR